MQAGDPFDTKARDERRARQRRDLRLVDDGVLRTATMGMEPPAQVYVHDADRGLVEEALRDAADARRNGDLGNVLLEAGKLLTAEALNRFANLTYNHRSGRAEGFGLEMEREAKAVIAKLQGLEVSDSHMLAMGDYALALILADEIANDGYRDPRLSDLV